MPLENNNKKSTILKSYKRANGADVTEYLNGSKYISYPNGSSKFVPAGKNENNENISFQMGAKRKTRKHSKKSKKTRKH